MLHELSEDVSRIASTLARLAMVPDAFKAAGENHPANDQSKLNPPIETVRDLIHARHLRFRYFDKSLFADPAWDILLDLFHAEVARQHVTLSSLCVAASVPPATADRWIQIMSDANLLRRYSDPDGAGEELVALSPLASQAMRNFFNELGKPHPPSGENGRKD